MGINIATVAALLMTSVNATVNRNTTSMAP